MATLWSIVVRLCAFRIACGMNEVSLVVFGMFPSLHESMRICRKSMFRVSSIPIICMPWMGSPWKGMVVFAASWLMSRRRIGRSDCRVWLVMSFSIRVRRVYIRKSDSSNSGSFISAPFRAMVAVIRARYARRGDGLSGVCGCGWRMVFGCGVM